VFVIHGILEMELQTVMVNCFKLLKLWIIYAVYITLKDVTFFRGPALFNQPEQFKSLQKAVIGWKKDRSTKKATLFLDM